MRVGPDQAVRWMLVLVVLGLLALLCWLWHGFEMLPI